MKMEATEEREAWVDDSNAWSLTTDVPWCIQHHSRVRTAASKKWPT
ncbi:hypothetical protein BSU04_19890 [Caballeronia sordidicola]|uniref:Uncharacterized protein n=1 Tax=Caballeronia sordidicola TaxID=196367 RepID=A0A226X0C0_CABSO|nr:hypothetical protein BSU04_19890 [Caballeronia sordidicola]